MLGSICAGKAQQVLTAPPSYSSTPPAVQAEQSSGMGNVENSVAASFLPSPSDLFHWGPVNIRPHLLYRAFYGDGIQSTPGAASKVFVQEFSPGASFAIGNFWSVDYTPTLTFYSSKQFQDTTDHAIILTGGAKTEDWVFGLTQSATIANDPLVETGTQTATEYFSTSGTASYRFNSKMSVDLALTQVFSSADKFSSSRTWNTMDYLNYQFWPRFTASIGAGAGYDSVDSGPDMIHEQLQARISWKVFDKLSLEVHGGAEDRQFRQEGIQDLISPVYGATVKYTPFEVTSFSLNAERGITPAITSGSLSSESTTLNVIWDQRLLKRLDLMVTGSYSDVSYLASFLNLVATREDKFYSLNTRLSFHFLKRATAAVFYQYNENTSSVPGFGFSSSQEGVELGYRF